MQRNQIALAFLIVFAVAGTVRATPYSMPYTESFGSARTGQASSVVVTVTDASGTERIGPGESNEPSIAESVDASGTADTGSYSEILPLDTSWGPLHFRAVITGQAGVVAESSITNAPVQTADQQANVTAGLSTQGLTSGRAANLDNLDAAVSSRSTFSSANLPTEYLSSSEQSHLENADSQSASNQTAIAALPSAASIASALAPSFSTLSGVIGSPQQAGQAVTLPVGAPGWYVTPATVAQIQALLPGNLAQLAIDGSGRVSVVGGGTGGGGSAPVVHR